MRGRGRATAGEFRLEQPLDALVRLVAFGQQLPAAFGPLPEPALRSVQKNLLDPVAPSTALESNFNRGRQAGADRLQSPDFLVSAGVSIEQRPGRCAQQGRFSRFIGRGENVQTGGQWTQARPFTKWPDVAQFDVFENHEPTS